MMKKILLLMIFTLFICDTVKAENDHYERLYNDVSKAKDRAVQEWDLLSAMNCCVDISKFMNPALEQSINEKERNKYIRRRIELFVELAMLCMFREKDPNWASQLASHALFRLAHPWLLENCKVYRLEEIKKSATVIERNCKRRVSLQEYKKILNTCMNIILPPTLKLHYSPSAPSRVAPSSPNYVVRQTPNFTPQPQVYVPSGGGYSIPVVNYKRNCTRPGHGCYDIRYGGCPACRAPKFGL